MNLVDLARIASHSRTKLHVRLSHLVVAGNIVRELESIGTEQAKIAELRNSSLEPRSSLLIQGGPGSGKSSLAQAFALDILSVDILDVYDCSIGPGLSQPAPNPSSQGIRMRLAPPPCVLLESCHLLGAKLATILDDIPGNTVVICTAPERADGIDQRAMRRFDAVVATGHPDQYACREALRKMGVGGTSLEDAAPVLSRLGVAYSGIQRFVLNARRRKVLTPNMTEHEAIKAELANPTDRTIRRF